MDKKPTEHQYNFRELLFNTRVESKVYATNDDLISYIKVDFLDLGFYINSITVRPNPRDEDKLWVQMPKFRIGAARWVAPLEFRSDSSLRELVTKHALKAYYECYGDDLEWDDFLNHHYPP